MSPENPPLGCEGEQLICVAESLGVAPPKGNKQSVPACCPAPPSIALAPRQSHRLFRQSKVEVLDQLHRTLDVGEQHSDRFALAFDVFGRGRSLCYPN